ncbi:MAG: nuclear transport factor 2 family protein [Candidatus Cyclobacteriaceae bacterium M2_1C_046]
MKNLVILLTIMLTYGCNQQSHPLTLAEVEKIKSEIIERSEKHASDLENLDYNSVMTFYSNDHIFFGDGYYWGDYTTVDGIWKDHLGEEGWKKPVKMDLQNHKIHVFSKEAASYMVEFDHEHLAKNGNTIEASGCFTYGMQKIDGEWKAVTGHVTHISKRTDAEKWWSKYSPSYRNK